MSCIVLRKHRKRQRKSRKYGRGQPPYIKNNRIYFGGKIHRGRGIGQVVNLLNLVGKVLEF